MGIKVLTVKGSSGVRDGQVVSSLADDIEKAIKDFSETIDGKIVDVEFQADFGKLTAGGSALVMVQYDGTLRQEKRGPGRPPKTDK